MDTVKISNRFACVNEQSKWHFGKLKYGYALGLVYDVPPSPFPLPFPLSFKTLRRFSKASRLLVLYPWGEASIWEGREYQNFDR